MDILNKPISSFSFDDIVAFCQEGHREGLQLDYKRELPTDLSKSFAAFSNTRGGAILVGVEEDRQTGIPTAWSGVPNVAQSIERVHQWASNIDPFPSYEVHATNEQNGNIFILIRIFEGDRTPYYVQNDAHVYVRTGNITSSVDIASPEMLELLFGKKEKANIIRTLNVRQSDEIYGAGLRRAERERKRLIREERHKYEQRKADLLASNQATTPYQCSYYEKQIGEEVSLLTIIIQPFYPQDILLQPRDIKERILEIRDGDGMFQINYPELNMEAIPNGVMDFDVDFHTGRINFQQILSNGLVRISYDLLNVNGNSSKQIYLAHIASFIFQVLKAARNFYRMTDYQAGLKGFIILEGAESVELRHELGQSMFPTTGKSGLLPEYRYDISFDTSLLNDDLLFQNYFINTVKEIYWMFGYENLNEASIINYLKGRNWYKEE